MVELRVNIQRYYYSVYKDHVHKIQNIHKVF